MASQPDENRSSSPETEEIRQIPVKSQKDIEKEEELKLRSKYPQMKTGAGGGSGFLQKRLQKGQKYFDSGDYNMAKSKVGGIKKPTNPADKLLMTSQAGSAIPTPDNIPHRKPSLSQSKLAASLS